MADQPQSRPDWLGTITKVASAAAALIALVRSIW